MKNISGRDGSFGIKILILVIGGTLLSIAGIMLQIRLHKSLIVSYAPAAAAILILTVLVIKNYATGLSGGKITNVYFASSDKKAFMIAIDSTNVFEYNVDYDTRADVDYISERIQIVDLAGKKIFERKGKSSRTNNLKFSEQHGVEATFKSRNAGTFVLNLITGDVKFTDGEKSQGKNKSSKSIRENIQKEKMKDRLDAGEDKTALRAHKIHLKSGDHLELSGSLEKIVLSNGAASSEKKFGGASFLINDTQASNPIQFSNPPGALIYHSRKVGRRLCLAISRITSTGEQVWEMLEPEIFPRKIKSEYGKTRLHSVFGNDSIIVLVFKTPPRYDDIAFGISSETGKPLWKYNF